MKTKALQQVWESFPREPDAEIIEPEEAGIGDTPNDSVEEPLQREWLAFDLREISISLIERPETRARRFNKSPRSAFQQQPLALVFAVLRPAHAC